MKPLQSILAVAVISFSLLIGSQALPLHAKQNFSTVSAQIAGVFKDDARSSSFNGAADVRFKVMRDGHLLVMKVCAPTPALEQFVKDKLNQVQLTAGTFSGKVLKAELVF